MWVCLLSTAKGLPTPAARMAAMREANAQGKPVRLVLPASAGPQFADAQAGQEILFGMRDRGRWLIFGQAKISGKISQAKVSATARGAEITATVCALNEVELYDPPRSEADFDLPEKIWPRGGRSFVTWVDVPDPGLGHRFERSTVPRGLYDGATRRQAGLPADEAEHGSYIVELNVTHIGGLPGAAVAFEVLYAEIVGGNARANVRWPDPVRIAKSYYRCRMSVDEWQKLVAEDGRRAAMAARQPGGHPDDQRCIYKLWPDFKVRALMDRSIATIKADAVRRTFEATGDGITWAVLDSGISADHPHFGTEDASHTLRSRDAVDLHRSFVHVFTSVSGVLVDQGPIPSPDVDPSINPEARRRSLTATAQPRFRTRAATELTSPGSSLDRRRLTVQSCFEFLSDRPGPTRMGTVSPAATVPARPSERGSPASRRCASL